MPIFKSSKMHPYFLPFVPVLSATKVSQSLNHSHLMLFVGFPCGYVFLCSALSSKDVKMTSPLQPVLILEYSSFSLYSVSIYIL